MKQIETSKVQSDSVRFKVIPKKGGEQEGHSIAEQSDEMGNLLWDLDLVVSPTAPNSINNQNISYHMSYIIFIYILYIIYIYHTYIFIILYIYYKYKLYI